MLLRRYSCTDAGISGIEDELMAYLSSNTDTCVNSDVTDGTRNITITHTSSRHSNRVMNTASALPFIRNNLRLYCTKGSSMYATSHATTKGNSTSCNTSISHITPANNAKAYQHSHHPVKCIRLVSKTVFDYFVIMVLFPS